MVLASIKVQLVLCGSPTMGGNIFMVMSASHFRCMRPSPTTQTLTQNRGEVHHVSYVQSLRAQQHGLPLCLFVGITLFRYITMFCGTDKILHNFSHVHVGCEKYYATSCKVPQNVVMVSIILWSCFSLIKKKDIKVRTKWGLHSKRETYRGNTHVSWPRMTLLQKHDKVWFGNHVNSCYFIFYY